MRTYARNRFERVVQVIRWLNEEFDIFEPGAVRIEWMETIAPIGPSGKDSVYGCVFERGHKLVVQLSKRNCATRHQAIETAIHEMAHVALWDAGRGCLHGKEYWVTYGRFIDAYNDRGYEDSKSYFVD